MVEGLGPHRHEAPTDLPSSVSACDRLIPWSRDPADHSVTTQGDGRRRNPGGTGRPPVHGVDSLVSGFLPTYFTATMTFGAISIGSEQLGLHGLAAAILVLGLVTLLLSSVLLTARLARHPGEVVADLTHHATAFTILSVVAAFSIIGGAVVVVFGWTSLGWICWAIAVALWPPLLYASVLSTIIEAPKPPLALGINGTWFLMTVSTQTVVSTTAILLTQTGSNQLLELLAVGGFGLGIVLYLIVMTLLFLRWVFADSTPDEDDPPSWTAAGAMATTAIAGSRILSLGAEYPLIERLTPFVEGLVIVGWVTATFWLPLMVAVQVWRHGVHRLPFVFTPAQWSMVFPLATYGAATFAVASETGLDVLDPIPPLFLTLALAGSVVVGVAMVRSISSTLRSGT